MRHFWFEIKLVAMRNMDGTNLTLANSCQRTFNHNRESFHSSGDIGGSDDWSDGARVCLTASVIRIN